MRAMHTCAQARSLAANFACHEQRLRGRRVRLGSALIGLPLLLTAVTKKSLLVGWCRRWRQAGRARLPHIIIQTPSLESIVISAKGIIKSTRASSAYPHDETIRVFSFFCLLLSCLPVPAPTPLSSSAPSHETAPPEGTAMNPCSASTSSSLPMPMNRRPRPYPQREFSRNCAICRPQPCRLKASRHLEAFSPSLLDKGGASGE